MLLRPRTSYVLLLDREVLGRTSSLSQLFNSTLVVNGEGWGGEFMDVIPSMARANLTRVVVVRTGDHTMIGERRTVRYLCAAELTA